MSQLALKEEQLPVVAASERGVELRSFDDMMRFAELAVRSRMIPKDLSTPEAAFLAIQHGAELGLSPAQSLQSIAVINGKPSVYGDAALALAMANPEFIDINEVFTGEGENITAECTIQRKGRAPVKRTFSRKDADRAGLTKKSGPWENYPKRMLQMRARAFALRDSFPDALKGIGIREETQDYGTTEPKPLKGIVLPDEPEETTPALTLEAE